MSLKYRISNVGWYNFELLVQSLLKVIIGPGVTSFGGSKDQGRDAQFAGPAEFPSSKCQWDGNWLFQVKYIDFEERGVDAARSSLKSALRHELQGGLVRHRNTNNYVLLTDVPLTAQLRDELSQVAADSGFKGNFASVDGKEICQFLDSQSDIRRSYPQLLGLADLDVIVNRDLYARSQAFLQNWQPRLATYVQTVAHARAMSLLKKTHFIVLDGAPEAGKSTIAAALALIHAAEGFEIIDVRSSNDVFRASDERDIGGRKKEKKRLFIADDAIGSINLVAARAEEWSRDLPGIIQQLSKNRLLVWTARRYILEEALATSRLREAEAEFPRPHEVLVKVGDLTYMQKAEILYNHAKQANLSGEHRELIRKYATHIISHENFSPLRMRELTTIILKKSAEDSKASNATWETIARFLDNPGDTWIQAYKGLSQSEQTLLSAMLDFDGPAAARDLRANYELRVSRLEQGHLSFADCVARLDHSFLTVTTSHSGEQSISVQHPSLRDMLLLHLRGDAGARRRYISLASAFGLAGMIGGIAERSESENDPQHSLIPVNDEEFALFLERLRNVSQSVLMVRDWSFLLSACERLIPEKTDGSSETTPAIDEFWRLAGERSPAEKVEPADLDLESFGSMSAGTIFRAVLTGFSSKSTFENSQRLGADDWVRLLTHFYRLTAYLSPPIYPAFTTSLCADLSNCTDSIRLANLIHRAEPLVAKQRISRALREEWKHKLDEEANELAVEGEAFGYTDDPDEFDQWHSSSQELLKAAKDFVQWAVAEPIGGVEKLVEVFDSSDRPREAEPDEYHDSGSRDPGPYWTVERLFEDL